MSSYASDFILVTGLMVVGSWLESIGEITDRVDRLLTPFSMGFLGLILIALQRGLS